MEPLRGWNIHNACDPDPERPRRCAFVCSSTTRATCGSLALGLPPKCRASLRRPAPPEIVAGTRAYMGPEQTGRMNRSSDTRSDICLPRTTLISKMRRLAINLAPSSGLPVRAAASVPGSEDPALQNPPLNATSREGASPHFEAGRLCAIAEA